MKVSELIEALKLADPEACVKVIGQGLAEGSVVDVKVAQILKCYYKESYSIQDQEGLDDQYKHDKSQAIDIILY